MAKGKRDVKALFVENRNRATGQTTGLQARTRKARLAAGYPVSTGAVTPEPPETMSNGPVESGARKVASFLHKITAPVSTPKRSNESEQLEDRQEYEQTPEGNVKRGPR